VIVLVPEPAARAARAGHSLADFLRTLSQRPRSVRSKEEIDRELARERETWEVYRDQDLVVSRGSS
jgi:hypothetical protein